MGEELGKKEDNVNGGKIFAKLLGFPPFWFRSCISDGSIEERG